MTIAVDFDGCLCKDEWPDIGEPNQLVINALVKRKAEGAKIILWTCREGQHLQAAVMWCLNHGLKFDAINDNLEENKAAYGNNCRKVWADEYWDDKAIPVLLPSISEIPSLEEARGKRIKAFWNILLGLEG